MGILQLFRNPVLGLGAVFFIFPFVSPNKALGIQILIWGLFALSYNLLLGYAGLLSFAHATFFGIGALAGALLMKHWAPTLPGGLLFSVAAAAVAAFTVGWLSLRQRGVTFTMLTLAFSQMVYFIGFSPLSWLTGGDNGLRGVPAPSLRLPGLGELALNSVRYPYRFYFFCLLLTLLSMYVLWRLIRSPFGDALRAVRESEERARAVGYNTRAIQLVAFTLSGMLAGLSGILYALYLGYVPINALHLNTSGTVLMMTILGGKGTFIGPFLGAAVYWVLADYVSRVTEYWPLALGLLFILTIYFFPNGLSGLFSRLLARILPRWAPSEVAPVGAERQSWQRIRRFSEPKV